MFEQERRTPSSASGGGEPPLPSADQAPGGRGRPPLLGIVRWLLVVPFALAAWYVVFGAGVFTYSWLESALCPPQEFVSGFCVNTRVMTILDVVVYAFIGLSAVAVVVVAVATAPAHRDIVAWGTFAFGAAMAVLVGAGGRAYGEIATAILAGLVTAAMAASIARSSPPPPSP